MSKIKIIDGIEYRFCKKCNEYKLLETEFYKSNKKTGVSYSCKKCTKEKIYAWRKENIERQRANQRRSAAKYRENNREKVNEWLKEYRKTEKYKEYSRRTCKIKSSLRRKRIKFYKNDLTIEQWEQCLEYFDNKCCYCGTENNGTLCKDHFNPISKGGGITVGNIVPACKSCNGSKSNINFFVWYPKYRFYSRERKDKILRYLSKFNNL